jgi:FkbM family methyltransferase
MYHLRSSYLWEETYLWPEKDIHLWKHLNKEKYGPIVTEHITSIAPRHNTIIQAGGACGLYADYYSNHFKTVYTFEPDPDNFRCLMVNAGRPNVCKLNYALGAEDKNIHIYNDYKNFGATHVCDESEIETKKYTNKSRMITIDQLGLEPDVIHLDIEGYETEALKGGYDTIMRHTPLLVLETVDNYVTDVLGYNLIGEIGADKIFFKKNEKKVI